VTSRYLAHNGRLSADAFERIVAAVVKNGPEGMPAARYGHRVTDMVVNVMNLVPMDPMKKAAANLRALLYARLRDGAKP